MGMSNPWRRVAVAGALLCALGAAPAAAQTPQDVVVHSGRSAPPLHTSADIARAREKLGYEPSTPLEDGLRRVRVGARV